MNSWTEYEPQFVRHRYNRLAKIYRLFEWMFLLPPGIRAKAAKRLKLKQGSSVLEVGCGTGRNFRYLIDEVGPQGHIYGVDLSEGMLAEAASLCSRQGWTNVTLLHTDAAKYQLPEKVDGALFSLSYATMPHRRRVLRYAWEQVKPGGTLLMMDACRLSGVPAKILYPFAVWTLKLTVLGSPDIDAVEDLRALTGEVEVEKFSFGTYFIARVAKPVQPAS